VVVPSHRFDVALQVGERVVYMVTGELLELNV